MRWFRSILTLSFFIFLTMLAAADVAVSKECDYGIGKWEFCNDTANIASYDDPFSNKPKLIVLSVLCTNQGSLIMAILSQDNVAASILKNGAEFWFHSHRSRVDLKSNVQRNGTIIFSADSAETFRKVLDMVKSEREGFSVMPLNKHKPLIAFSSKNSSKTISEVEVRCGDNPSYYVD